MNYSQIKKLDERSLQKLTEGRGPSDKCLCSLLSPPDDDKKSLAASIKKAFASFRQGKKRRGVDVPLSFAKGGKVLQTTKHVLKRKSSCGKCGCDSEQVVLKHSNANIRITSPDVSSFCPCSSDCMPDKEMFKNNIKVTIERVQVLNVDSVDSEFSIYQREKRLTVSEPLLLSKRSVSSLMDAQYEDDDACSVWSRGDEEGISMQYTICKKARVGSR